MRSYLDQDHDVETLSRKCRIMPEITLLTVDKIRQENQADSEKKTKQEPQKKRT